MMKQKQVVEINRCYPDSSETIVSYMNLLSSYSTYPFISLLIRKEIVDSVGLLNASLSVLSNRDYILRIMQKGDINTLHEPLAHFHLRAEQATGNYSNYSRREAENFSTYKILYINNLIRNMANSDPSSIALLQAMVENNKLMLKNLEDDEIIKNSRIIWENQRALDKPAIKKIHKGISRKILDELRRWKIRYFKFI